MVCNCVASFFSNKLSSRFAVITPMGKFSLPLYATKKINLFDRLCAYYVHALTHTCRPISLNSNN